MWKQFDLFPKGEYDKTACRGILTIATVITVIIVVVFEIAQCLQITVESGIDNTNLDERVRVNLNITFHETSCSALSIDLQDVTGGHLEDVQYTVHKLRMINGQHYNSLQAKQLRQFEEGIYEGHTTIDDCYGAQLYEGQRCITCQDVMMAYASREWPQPSRGQIKQCMYGYIQQQGRMLLDVSVQPHWDNRDIIINGIHGQIKYLSSLRRESCELAIDIIITINGVEYQIVMQEQMCQVILKYKVIANDAYEIQLQNITVPLHSSTQLTILDGPILYVHFNQQRLLFTEDFGREKRSPQLLNMQDLTDIMMTQGEGCQFYGHFYIKKVPGNFHFAFHGRGQAAMLLAQEQTISHSIHLLEFTAEHERTSNGYYMVTTNTLDNTVHKNKQSEDSQYYIKLVEAQYNTQMTSADLYTFTAYESRQLSKENLPKVEFKYEFDGITMKYSSKSFFQIIVTICAVFGGIFSISMYIAAILDKVGY